MSLIVEHLTKFYKSQKAVDDISFSAKEGEILGFLGPNGAGKSTTMKIATGFIRQSSGRILICGLDTTIDTKKTKQLIGYLPEHNPLYLDMYLKEYLKFSADVHGMNRKLATERIQTLIEKTGLGPESNKKIGALSKGYRQRVGLANALLHDPKVLILDEPTTGLDPNQIVEIRNLIKEIAQNKTVILSTHLMQEVQELCHKVVIINKGKIVANDSLETLTSTSSQGKSNVIVDFGASVSIPEYLNEYFVELHELGQGKFKFVTHDDQSLKSNLFKFASENNLTLTSLVTEHLGLEEVFRNLTQATK